MNNLDFTEGFFRVFNPDTAKYVEHDLSGNMSIRTVRKELTRNLVEESLRQTSQNAISFFSKVGMIDYFGLDIDAHDLKGWEDSKPTPILEDRFILAKRIIGEKPSLVFGSPRGIHAYWFLIQPVPNKIIQETLYGLFNGIKHFEILPTSRHALRIPSPDRYLNENLECCGFPGFESLIRYSKESVFKNGIKFEKSDNGHEEEGVSKRAIKVIDAPRSLEHLENSVLPLKNGQTNDAYIKLVARYKIHGLDESQAHARFVELKNKSPGYTGPLMADLENRIRTSYRQMAFVINLSEAKSLSALLRDPQISMAIATCIKKMGLDIPKKAKMKKSMMTFLLNIVSWKAACDKIFKAHETAHYWEYLYKGSWWMHKEGYYPLPYSLLRKWNTHYDRPLKLLKGIGVLEESPFRYSTILKRCKYYRILIPSDPVNQNCGGILKGDTYYT